MKLYFSPGACSLAVHIALRETGAKFDLEKVDLEKHKTATGEDYYGVNPKGYVPALELDNGELLTEVGTVLQYVADQKPESGLAPKMGTTMERYRLMEWLNFISSEIHKTFAPFFHDAPEQTKAAAKEQLARRFDYVEAKLGKHAWLTSDAFTIVDIYLFVIANWTNFQEIDVSKWPKLKDFMARAADRPKVQEAMKAEGLGK